MFKGAEPTGRKMVNMRDMREGINKAIELQEEDIKIHGGVELSDRDKELIEHGYIQCALQIGSDIGMKSESFVNGLREMVLSSTYVKSQLKVFEINESEIVMAITEDEAKEYYEANISEVNEDDILELDLDKKGMWYPTKEAEDIERIAEGKDIDHTPTQFGDLMWYEGDLHKFMPYRKVIELQGEYTGPEVIASSEY